MKQKVYIKDYGAKAGIDCKDIFQKAEDDMFAAGGGIILGEKNVIYDVSGPFIHRSFVTLNGRGCTIRNSVPAGRQAENFTIYVGNFDPSTYEECVHYDVNDITAGLNMVTLSKLTDAANFKVGDTVLIDTTDGFTSDKGKFKPYQAFINRITNISGAVITLEDPISVDVKHAKIAPTNKFKAGTNNDPDKIYICTRPIIKNVRFESLGNWTMRFGIYKGLFENVSLKTTDMIGGNGLSHCTFKNIKGEFSQKPVEMAMYSHDVLIDGLTATWWDGYADDSGMKPLLKMGENMRNCELKNISIDAGQGKYFGMCIRFEHAFSNKITNCTFNCAAVKQNAVELTTNDPASIVTGNEVSGNKFFLGNTDSQIKIDVGGTSANVSGNKIINNTFSGATRKDKVIMNGGSNNEVTPNVFM